MKHRMIGEEVSASEKLKRLGVWEDLGGDTGPYDVCERRQAQALLDALPQILAVVEAAQRAESVLVAPMSEGWGPDERDLRSALTALDECLGAQ